jgi:hypothetical protein
MIPVDTLAPYVLQYVFPPAFAMLPAPMETIDAKAMLLAIGFQESRFSHRHQVKGPAHGFYQFEKLGGIKGVLTHRVTAEPIRRVCQGLCYQPSVDGCYLAVEHNDVLATCFARLLLWTLPSSLPSREESVEGWNQYLECWRPGKPHRETWDANYARAWAMVTGERP